MDTIWSVYLSSSSAADSGLWHWPYSDSPPLLLPLSQRKAETFILQNHNLFWKGLVGVAPMGCHPWTQGVLLGHWFSIVLWHAFILLTLSPNPEFRGNVHLLSHLGNCLITYLSKSSAKLKKLGASYQATRSSWFTLLVEKIVSERHVIIYMGFLLWFLCWY